MYPPRFEQKAQGFRCAARTGATATYATPEKHAEYFPRCSFAILTPHRRTHQRSVGFLRLLTPLIDARVDTHHFLFTKINGRGGAENIFK